MLQERILLLMQARGLNPTQFADEIGVQRSSISHILSGRNNPSLDIITKILNRFPDINSDWLVLGKGSLFNESIQKSDEISLKESLKENTLFDNFEEEFPSKDIKLEEEKTKEQNVINNNQEVIHNKNVESISEKQFSPQRSIEKKISKIIIFYSDYTYEELFKN